MVNTPSEGTPTETPGPVTQITQMAPGLKAGVKTTEFWVSVAALVIASILLYKGKDELAAFVTGAVGITFPTVRAVAKKAASVALKGVGVMVLLLAMVGCCVGHVRAAAISPTFKRIRARHDHDLTSQGVQRIADLTDTEIVDEALDEAVRNESR